MLAEDGFTYERENIETWFETRRRDGLPFTSPKTGAQIGSKLTENKDMKIRITELQDRTKAVDAAAKQKGKKNTIPPPKSLDQLAEHFRDLDPIRAELADTLDSWSPPVIVVIGDESSGKSTILHRISWLPYFPRGENICTRLPILVSLRSGERQPPVLQVMNRGSVHSSETFPTTNYEEALRTCMEKAIGQENQNGKGISQTKQLRLKLTGPLLPTLDLLDMPGLVRIPNTDGGEPETMKEDTHELARSIIGQYKDRAVFLAIRKINDENRSSATLELLREFTNDISSKTLGVFTHCDRSLKTEVVSKMESPGHMVRFEHGYVATSNNPKSKNLKDQAKSEQKFFSSTKGLRDLVDSKRATSNALVERISDIYANHLSQEWMPTTLRLLCEKQLAFDDENRILGLPMAHAGVTTELKQKVCERVLKVTSEVFDTQMDSLVGNVFIPLKQNILKCLARCEGKCVPLTGYTQHAASVLNELRGFAMKAAAALLLDAASQVEERLLNDTSAVRVSRFGGVVERLKQHMEESASQNIKTLKERVVSVLGKKFDQYAEPSLDLEKREARLHISSHSSVADSVCECLVSFCYTVKKYIKRSYAKIRSIIDETSDSDFMESCSHRRKEIAAGKAMLVKVQQKLLALHKKHCSSDTRQLVGGQRVRFLVDGIEHFGSYCKTLPSGKHFCLRMTDAGLEGIEVSVVHVVHGGLDSLLPQSGELQPKRTLNIEIKDQLGDIKYFRVSYTTKCNKIFQAYANMRGIPVDKLRFLLDGDRIDECHTPKMWKMEDGDQITALLEQTGDIGIFGTHAKSPGIEYLTTNAYLSYERALNLIRTTKASLNATFLNQKQLSILVKTQRHALMQRADEEWDGRSLDLKIQLSDAELTKLIGKKSFAQLSALMGGMHDTILLRRCMEHGKVIKFHTDYSYQTLQVPLNEDYKGGHLVYITQRGMEYPDRSAGSFTLHRNDILHGVTRLESGIRYGLFLLQKKE